MHIPALPGASYFQNAAEAEMEAGACGSGLGASWRP